MSRLRPDDVQRYSALIESALGRLFLFRAETEIGSAVQVERGTIFPMCVRGSGSAELGSRLGRLAQLADQEKAGGVTVVDRAGHTRPAYLGLLLYSCIQAYRLCRDDISNLPFEQWADVLRAWGGVIEAQTSPFEWPIGGMPALRGAGAAASAWVALALYAGGLAFRDERWTQIAHDTFGRLAAGQQASGAFLRASASDNPETLWYHELVLLHAATSYAAQSNNALVTAAVMQAADYHLTQTQPDHASAQPWGILAFIWRGETRPLADQMLHALKVQQPGLPDGVSSILLADALYCLRLLGRP